MDTLANSNTYQKGILSIQKQNCVFNVGTLSHQGEIRVNPALKQRISIQSGENNGKIIGQDLSLDIQDTFKNAGQMAIQELSGDGTFVNQKHLQFNGAAQTPSRISIKNFDNSPLNAQEPEHSVRVTGSHIIVTPENKQFTTQEKSEMILKSLIFSPLSGNPFSGPAVTPTFVNKGILQADEQIVIHRQGMVNAGSMRTLKLTVSGWQFENAKGASLTVDQEMNAADVTGFQNDGEMTTKGQYTQQKGQLTNTGFWDHTGGVNLGTTKLSNKGTLQWQNGRWDFVPTTFENHGKWQLNQMLCFQNLNMTNYGILDLNCDKLACGLVFGLTFGHLINHKTLIVSGGSYTFASSFINNGVMQLLNSDWKFTQDPDSKVPIQLGEIESGKSYTHDVPVMPQAIRANGDVTFTKRYQHMRTLADLKRVATPNKVTFYCPSTRINTAHTFNFGHLELYMEGVLTIAHEFKAPSLSLNVNGSLIFETWKNTWTQPKTIPFQANNKAFGNFFWNSAVSSPIEPVVTEGMGTIASTQGPLNITAHNVDAKHGKIFGTTSGHIKTTRGDILIGEAKQGTGSEAHIGNYTRNVMNGAYVASNGSLNLESATNILVDYGQVISGGDQHLRAVNLIRNIASKLYSAQSIYLNGKEYLNTRAGITNIGGIDCPLSGPALIDGLGDVVLNVKTVTNVASDILSGARLLVNNVPLKKSGSYKEEIYNLGQTSTSTYWERIFQETSDRGSGYWTEIQRTHTAYSPNIWKLGCNTRTAREIRINTGDFVITSAMNSPFIAIQARGAGLFRDVKSNHHSATLSQPILVNLYEWIQREIQDNGFFFKKLSGEIISEFPLGKPSLPQSNQEVAIAHNALSHGLSPMMSKQGLPGYSPRIFNPLQSLNLNLWIQQALSQKIGKVHIRDHRGRRIAGKDLALGLWDNAGEWRKKNKKAIISQEELANISTAMLLYGFQQEGNILHQLTYLAVPPDEYNDAQRVWADVIDVATEGDLTFQDTTMRARHLLKLYSDKKLSFHSSVSTHSHPNGTYQTVENQTAVECTDGPLLAVGRTGFKMTGAKLRALLDLVAGSTEGNTDIQNVQLKRTDTYSVEEDDTTTQVESILTASCPSELESQKKDMTILCGKKAKTTITASYLKALEAIIFQGEELETNADMGMNSTTTKSQTESMFSSSRRTSTQQTANVFQTNIDAKVIHTNTKKAVYNGTDFIADTLYDNTEEGVIFGFNLATLKFFHQMISESPLAKSDIGCEGDYEVMAPCRLGIKEIIRNIDSGQIQLNSAIWNPNRTKIIGKFAETTYQLKQSQRSWNETEQVLPDGALVAIAFGIALATQGMGASLINGLSSSMFGTVNVAATATMAATVLPTIHLTTMGAAMASAGFTTLCTQAATSYLRTGNPIAAAKDLVSDQGIRSLAISVASAGICNKLGEMMNIKMEPGQKAFIQHVKEHTLREVVGSSLHVAICNQPVEEVVPTTLKRIPLKAIAAFIANKIGALYADAKIGYIEHKFDHAVLGGVTGWIIDPTRDGFISGATGAVTAEIIGEALISDAQELAETVKEKAKEKGATLTSETVDKAIEKEIYHRGKIAKVMAGAAAALSGQNACVAIETATNAVDNNLAPLALLLISPVAKQILIAGMATGSLMLASYMAKEKLDASSKEKQQDTISSGTSGGMPDPDWEPENKKLESSSPTKVEKLADEVAQKLEGDKTFAKGEGYVIRVPKGNKSIDIRIMEKGGQRTNPYYRISVNDKSAVTSTGEFSSNPQLTHLEINENSLEEILKIISKLRG